tara:strand:+ start:102 stop:1763 length:1662 start_codon:yes stop_codon:yes gene_type:complete
MYKGQAKVDKFIQHIQKWIENNSGKRPSPINEDPAECYGSALDLILDGFISDGTGCTEGSGPGESWFNGEFTWADICEAGENGEDLIDSGGVVYPMDVLFIILTQFQDGSNLCSCLDETPETCNEDILEYDCDLFNEALALDTLQSLNFNATACQMWEEQYDTGDDWLGTFNIYPYTILQIGPPESTTPVEYTANGACCENMPDYVPGCTDPNSYSNENWDVGYDPEATHDDGTCISWENFCNNMSYLVGMNSNSLEAICEDPDNFLEDFDETNLLVTVGSNLECCDVWDFSDPEPDPIYGCMDDTAFNYNPDANTDDGSCCYIAGCTIQGSLNYDSDACYDDDSCIPMVFGCMDDAASNYNSEANVDDNSCVYEDDEWYPVDCTKVTPEDMGMYNYNKFCGNLDPNAFGKTGLCSDPEFPWPSDGLSLGNLGTFFQEQCECCGKKDIGPDKENDGEKVPLGMGWGCLGSVEENTGKFCLPLTPDTQIPAVYGVSITDVTLYDTQEECVSNTPCYPGTYDGSNEWLLSLPWPLNIDENFKNRFKELANIKKRG